MIKQNIKSKEKIITLASLTLFVLIISTIVFFGYKKQKILEKDFSIIEARITKVILNAHKGTTSRKNVARYTYEHLNKKYICTVEIYNMRILENTCYKIKVSNIDPEINEILLDQKIKCDE